MKILVDEYIPLMTVQALPTMGYDVRDVAHGMIIIRLRRPSRHKIHQRIMQALRQFDDAQWPGLLVVMRDVAQSTWRMPETSG